MKKGLIFDMDGVLIDAMPFHAAAMKLAIKEETKHDIDKKIVYLLEGMPGSKLVKEIFKRENIDENIDDELAEKISKRKKQIFKEIQNSKPIEGARELINDLKSCSCLCHFAMMRINLCRTSMICIICVIPICKRCFMFCICST